MIPATASLRYRKVLKTVFAALFLVGSLVAGVLGQQPVPSAPSEQKNDNSTTADQDGISPTNPGAYRIGAGDVLDIRVFNRPQLSRDSVRVDNGGTISMPLIGEVTAACRTEKDLASDISTRYLRYVRKPQVDVFVRDYQSQPIAIIGAVRSPGRFQLQRPVRLLEILSLAGGPSEKAGRTIQIINLSGDSPACQKEVPQATVGDESVASYALRETLGGDTKANPYLRPGDIITLLEADQVYVVGNVLRPTPIPLTEPRTVSQAIAIAGGVLPDTKRSRIRIVRRGNSGTGKTEIYVDLAAIDKRHAEDVMLQADDIVDVPVSSGKSFMRSLLNAVAPNVASMPVRVVTYK